MSILGIAIEFHLGMDWRWTLIDHGWDVGGYRDDDLSHNDIGNLCVAIGHIAKLEQLGYLKDGRPVAIEAM